MTEPLKLLILAAITAIAGALAFVPEALGAFPGANGKLAFERAGDIWVANPDGTGATRLTSGPARDSRPRWSPDGSKLVFHSSRDDPNPGSCISCELNVYRMNADGSGVTQLTSAAGTEKDPSWSPDGGKIAFLQLGEVSPGFSLMQLWTMNPDGSGQAQVTADDLDAKYDTAWSPDATTILFAGATGQQTWIVAIGPDGSPRPDSTPSFDGNELDPNWSPNGSKLLYTAFEYSNVFEDACVWGEVYVVNRDATGKADLTNNNDQFCGASQPDDRAATWSPDGTKIAFFSNRGPTGIWVMNPDGSSPSFLLGGEEPDWQPIAKGHTCRRGRSDPHGRPWGKHCHAGGGPCRTRHDDGQARRLPGHWM